MSRLIVLTALLTVVLPGMHLLHADDWPQWLGPQGDSVWRERGIIDKFPEGGPEVLWRTKIGKGYSGPAVSQGYVIVTDYITSEKSQYEGTQRDQLKGSERVLAAQRSNRRDHLEA
ncbi:MAG: PQQ-binding-like beta-propeller repeat protein [Planctomycetaceae bacterium]